MKITQKEFKDLQASVAEKPDKTVKVKPVLTEEQTAKRRAAAKAYYNANKERVAVTRRRYYAKNRERMIAVAKAWNKDNPERFAAHVEASRAKQRNT